MILRTIAILGLTLCMHGCAPGVHQTAADEIASVALADISKVVESYAGQVNRLIEPYTLRCRMCAASFPDSRRRVAIAGELPVGAATHVIHHFGDPPINTDTTSYVGLLRGLGTSEREQLGRIFQAMNAELEANHYVLEDTGNRYTTIAVLPEIGTGK